MKWHGNLKTFLYVFLIFLLSCQVALAEQLPMKGLAQELKAESAILMDENGVILFEKNSHKSLPPASVTKTMTLLLAVEAIEAGRIELEEPVTASENAWRQGGSQIWLEKGETMPFHELLIALAVVSANDAAVALMEHIYGSETAAVVAMNQRAQELGLQDTHFANVNGLPAQEHYMSTYDTAMLVKEAIRHPLYMETCGIKEYWLRNGKNWLVNTNKLLWWYPGADGLKTGWTEAAQYCFAGTAQREGLRLISVVFAAPEPRSHFRESMKLMDWGFANFKAKPVVKRAEIVTEANIARGTEESVRLAAAEDLEVLVSKDETDIIETKIVRNEDLTAPIAAGEKCGELLVLKGEKIYGKVDLIAQHAVEKAGFLHSLQSMFLKFLSI